MSIDTEDRRRSVAGIPMVPDSTIDADDRRHIAGFYRGIATAAPVEDEDTLLLLGVG